MQNKIQRFTQRARQMLTTAQEEAEALKSGEIGTEHLLLGLLRDPNSVAGRTLKNLSVEAELVRTSAISNAAPRARNALLELHSDVKKSLELAVEEARRMGHHYIGTEHLLLALARLEDCSAMTILKKRDISPEMIRREVRKALQESPVRTSSNEASTPLQSLPDNAPVSLRVTVKDKQSGAAIRSYKLSMAETNRIFQNILAAYTSLGESPGQTWTFTVEGIGEIEVSVEPNEAEQ